MYFSHVPQFCFLLTSFIGITYFNNCKKCDDHFLKYCLQYKLSSSKARLLSCRFLSGRLNSSGTSAFGCVFSQTLVFLDVHHLSRHLCIKVCVIFAMHLCVNVFHLCNNCSFVFAYQCFIDSINIHRMSSFSLPFYH